MAVAKLWPRMVENGTISNLNIKTRGNQICSVLQVRYRAPTSVILFRHKCEADLNKRGEAGHFTWNCHWRWVTSTSAGHTENKKIKKLFLSKLRPFYGVLCKARANPPLPFQNVGFWVFLGYFFRPLGGRKLIFGGTETPKKYWPLRQFLKFRKMRKIFPKLLIVAKSDPDTNCKLIFFAIFSP